MDYIFVSSTAQDLCATKNKPGRRSLEFITSISPGLPKNGDPARTIIRKQAMRQTAAAKIRAKTHTRKSPSPNQVPNLRFTGQDEITPEDEHAKPGLLARNSPCPNRIPANPSAKGYELSRARYGIDVNTLSRLTSFDIDRCTVEFLSTHHSRVKDILQQDIWSYFPYLPSRFEHAPFLMDVFECVAARVRQVLSPDCGIQGTFVLSLYSKALASLQRAVDCPQWQQEPELLCAISILSIFELLDISRRDAWIHHAAAARSLVKQQGAFTGDDEFRKALFIAQSGPIITESLLENEHCFLQEDAWQAVFRSVITPGDLHDRSQTVISLRMLMAYLPGVTSDVSRAVCSAEPVERHVIEALRARVQQYREKLLQWRRDLDALLADMQLSDKQRDLLNEMLGTYLVCLIAANRICVAIWVERSAELESSTQKNARLMLDMISCISPEKPHTYLFMRQKSKVAQIALDTTEDWQIDLADIHKGEYHAGIIPAWVFRRWAKLLSFPMPH